MQKDSNKGGTFGQMAYLGGLDMDSSVSRQPV